MALDLDRLLQEGQARGKAEQMAQQLAYLVMCQQAGLRLPNELIAMSIPQEIAAAQPNLMLQGAAQSQAQMRSASVHYPCLHPTASSLTCRARHTAGRTV